MRCVEVCPQKARVLPAPVLQMFSQKLAPFMEKRQENELYIEEKGLQIRWFAVLLYCLRYSCSAGAGGSRFVMLRRLMPSVDRLCSMAEDAGASTPAAPNPISVPLKPMTKR